MKWWQIRKRAADLERELQSDLELEEEQQRTNGLSAEEAPQAARRAFGNTTHGAGRRSNDFSRTLVTQCDNYGGLRHSVSSRS
jgi:hypothetical protein